MMKLIFLYGPPASGKLTIARELEKRIGFKLFHNHLTVDLVSSVFEFGSDSFVELRERIWLDVFKQAAIDGISMIFTFAPERTVRSSLIEQVKQAVEDNVIFVELTCDEAELERRVENKSRADFGKLNSVEFYRKLKADGVFDYSMPDPHFKVDTTSISPTETAKAIKEFLGE
jgi:broad-specificity NMP kinase